MLKKFIALLLGQQKQSNGGEVIYSYKTIHDREEFHQLVDLERERANRYKQRFSLVLVSANGGGRKDTIDLANKIKRRVRRIDQVGWYDDTSLGILLPNTAKTEAKKIAIDICDGQDDPQVALAISTLSYPN